MQHQGISGLDAFDRRRWIGAKTDVRTDAPRPQLPGRDLVRICADQPDDALRVLDVLTPLTIRLREAAARELIDQAEREMTVRGANPRGEFAQALHDAIDHAQHQALVEQRQHAMTATEARSELSTEAARPDAHQLT